MMRAGISILVLSLLAACDGPPTADGGAALDCSDGSCDCPVFIDAMPPEALETGGVILRGTAIHRRGLAIRNVIVGSRHASSDGVNFHTWTVRLGSEDVAALPAASDPPDGGRAVDIPIIVIDSTGLGCVAPPVRALVVPGDGPAPADGGRDPLDAGPDSGSSADAGVDDGGP